MKNKIFIVFALFLASTLSYSQDMQINILSVPASVTTSSAGKIQVNISNNDGGTQNLPNYKIRPLISIAGASGVTITGITDLPPGWTICSISADGKSIRVSNGMATIVPGDGVEFNINYTTNATTTGPSFPVTGTMSFAQGTLAGACNNGASTIGNNTSNDGSVSPFAITAALPLSLISFKANQFNETTNLVSWKTANEKDFDNFSIRASTDAKVFKEIGIVTGGSENGNYEFKDYRFTPGTITYYQLKMNDLDGTSKLSRIISVDNRENFWKENVFPNPSIDGVYYIKSITKFDNIQLLTNSGVKSNLIFSEKNGLYQIKIDKNLPKGSYLLEFKKGDTKYAKKLIYN
jgi:hypothetical protein